MGLKGGARIALGQQLLNSLIILRFSYVNFESLKLNFFILFKPYDDCSFIQLLN